ncbi:MAG: HRDC domain-containing protein [Deltaproteobacteria bacterium]|nr:HRDC domain-containing protein [Deltaproteobacteria bacterium]
MTTALPPIIETPPALLQLVGELEQEETVAVDLEADSFHCFFARVCLVQITSSRRTVLVDPLKLPDLDPLKTVMAERRIRKIFHAADYDIRCLHRDFGIVVRNLFDTMTACKLLGDKILGLADLLRNHFGVELDKKFQCANWALRPLPAEMLHYAAEDTRHLHRLAALIEQRLIDAGRLEWAREEFALLEELRHNDLPGQLIHAFPAAAAFDRRQLGALERLLKWRDEEARRQNRRYLHIVGGKALSSLAAALPETSAEMVGLEEVTPRLIRRYGADFVRIIEETRRLPEELLPLPPAIETRQRNLLANGLVRELKNWRQTAAAELALDPGILINNNLLEEIARRKPKSREDLKRIPALKKWQIEALGDQLLAQIAQPARKPKKKNSR